MISAAGSDCSTPLLLQFLLLPLDDALRAGAILSRFLHGREPRSADTPSLPLALGANELQDAWDAQTLVRRVLTAVAENLPIRTHDLAVIEAGAQGFDRRLGYTHAHITVTDVSGELALLTEAVLPQTVFLAHDGLPVQRLIADVFREMKYALGAHLSFQICTLCGLIHRDDRYSPHVCHGTAPRKEAPSEASHLVRPLPRTPDDEPDAETPEEETIYGVISDPAPIVFSVDERETVGVGAVYSESVTDTTRFERHAVQDDEVRYAPAQSPHATKRRPRPEAVSDPAKHIARPVSEETSPSDGHHPGAAYWGRN